MTGKSRIYSRDLGCGSREHSLPAPVYKYNFFGRECAGTHPTVWGDSDTPPHTGGSPPSTTARKREERNQEMMEFFMAMIPPTCTHQEKQVHVANGKPVFYEPEELKAARQKLTAHLKRYAPREQYG